MSLLQKASIITTPTAYAEDYLYSIKPAYALNEVVVNGTFDTDSDWDKSAGVTISNGKATVVVTGGGFQYINQNISYDLGATYRVKLTVQGLSGSSGKAIRFQDDGGNLGTLFQIKTLDETVQTFEAEWTPNSESEVIQIARSTSSGDYSFTVDNVSVKKITDADFDFDRNSTGTRVNEDYLIEDVPYNLLSYSNGFNNWSNSGTITRTGGQAGLYNTSDAWLITKGSAGAFIRQSNAQAGTRTFSVYAKADTATFLLLDIDGSPDAFQYYDLSNGVLGATGTNANAEIKHCGNGWYRCSVTGNDTYTEVRIYPAEGNNSVGATNTQLFLQNAQMVKGDQPKDYLKTTDRLDIPRIDYTNGEGSILLEPSRTNSLLQSNQFDTTWTNTRSSEQQGYTSPEGINNAWAFIDTTDNSTHLMAQSLSIGAGTFTFSIFAKKGSKDFLVVRFEGNTGVDYAYFNLNTGILGDINSDYTNASMQNYGNGWYRCILTRTTASSGNQVVIYSAQDNGDITYAGNADNAIYIYGGQVEAGSYATSLIHTSGSAVTRSADAANNSGNSDLINDSEGVLYAEIKALADDATNRRISLSDGTTANRMYISYKNYTNQIRAEVISSSSSVFDATYSAIDITIFSKIALKYKLNDFSLYIDGVEVANDTSGAVPTGLKELAFDDGVGNNDFYGNAKSVMVFKEALTDLELEKLTGYNNHELYMNYYNRLSYLGLVEEYNVESDINNYIL
jgi:hypothetical protein